MNIQRVKNLTAILLVLLNAMLAGLLYARGGEHRLSSAREAAVTRLLAGDGITVSSRFIKSFPPKDALETAPYGWDIYAEAARFFPQGEALAESESWNRVTLSGGGAALLLEDGFLMFETARPYTTEAYARKPDEKAARRLCDEYLERIRPQGLSFAFDRADAAEGGAAVYDYRGVYRGEQVYSNYIKLTVTEAGITVARCFYSGEPTGFAGYPRDVYAPDEALFALSKQLKMIYGGADVAITSMSAAYYLEEAAAEPAKAAPCYRFEVRVQEAYGTYFVDGYTNKVLR